MGYTHYFPQQRDFTPAEWLDCCDAAEKITGIAGVKLAFEYDEPDELPQIDGDYIRFNGVGDEGCETFLIRRLRLVEFNFCKTNHEPYDAVVTALLIAVHGIAPGALKIGSDGGSEDWGPGLLLAHQALGKPLVVPPGVIDRSLS